MKLTGQKALTEAYNRKGDWNRVDKAFINKYTNLLNFNHQGLLSYKSKADLKAFWFTHRRIREKDLAISMVTSDGEFNTTMPFYQTSFISLDITKGVPILVMDPIFSVVSEAPPVNTNVKNTPQGLGWQDWFGTTTDYDLREYFEDTFRPSPEELVLLELEEPDLYKAVMNRKKGLDGWNYVR